MAYQNCTIQKALEKMLLQAVNICLFPGNHWAYHTDGRRNLTVRTEWYWETTGKPITWANWRENDNDGPGYDYIRIYRGKWEKRLLNESTSYICEISLQRDEGRHILSIKHRRPDLSTEQLPQVLNSVRLLQLIER